MIYHLSRFIDNMLLRISAALSRYYIRLDRKGVYEDRIASWEPLTKEELRLVGKTEKRDFTIFKNMAGARDLAYYVPESVYRTIVIPTLNPWNHTPSGVNRDSCFSDKNYSELIMGGLRFPKVIFRRMQGVFYDANLRRITKEEALRLAEPYSELVFKRTIGTSHGSGVKLLPAQEFAAAAESFSTDYVVQERVIQHESFSYFNESSVNILRITSVFWKGTVYILGSILRVGAPGSFCDHLPYGDTHNRDIAVMDDGTLADTAFDPDHCLVYNDIYGKEIRGSIPRFDELKKLVIQEHEKYPAYGIIGWDFTLDQDGEILCMEFNTKWPGIFATQYAHGPVFAQKTKDGVPLLDEIMEAYKNRELP